MYTFLSRIRINRSKLSRLGVFIVKTEMRKSENVLIQGGPGSAGFCLAQMKTQ